MTRDAFPTQLREERSGDRSAILELHRAAFGRDSVAGLVEDLCAVTRPDERVSIVAVNEAGVVGHILLTRNVLDAPARQVSVDVLSPIAVDSAHRRRGIGGDLVIRALAIADQRRVPAVFLEGDPAYYARFGFVPAVPAGFRRPSLRIPDWAFQVRKLSAFAPGMTGTLVYREAFWRRDAVGRRDSGDVQT